MAIDLVKLKEKFFTDPDWAMMEDLILSYIEPLKDTLNIEVKGKSNDEIATELRGRQIAYNALDKFLRETKIISRRPSKPTTFK